MKASLSPERWGQVQHIFDQVVDLAPEACTARLDEVCRDDPTLREEVESLLVAYAQADDLLRSLDKLMPAPVVAAAASRAGTRVAHYEVLEKLGGGGMGIVYKARDTRLKRTVALKFLPPQLSAHAEAKARFMHEAQAASALDHTNICTIHEIGEASDGQLFIAMAYYEGQTLKNKIGQGPLPLDEALDIAAQMARGLAQAHAQRIIHRDIKPANVMITEPSPTRPGTGGVKIVDFGLAKMADVQLTKTGTTMGTVAYMSPEQARGEAVDARTDVWSLGVVLYEMLAGVRPFKGDYDQAIIYAILHVEPEALDTVNPETPSDLARVVARCLHKDPQQRYETASDLLADLERWQRRLTPSPDLELAQRAQVRARRHGILAGVGALVALLLLLAVPSVRQAVMQALGMSGLPKQKNLAVLPFVTEGDDADAAYADGLMETLTGKLASLEPFEEALWVVPVRDVRRHNIADPGAALQTFGANLAITGHVARESDSVRVTLAVVDTESLRTLKEETVTDHWANAAALQNGLTLAVVGLLDLDLHPQTRRLLTAGATTVPGAYEFYLQGKGYLQRYEQPEQIDLAIGLFEQALQEDPSYAQAYAGLGEAYWRKFEATKDVQWAELAEQQCDHALELDDGLTSVYLTLGMIHTGTGRYGPALADFNHVLDREPSNAAAHRGLAKAYEKLDRLSEAEASYRQAIVLKPDYSGGYNELGLFYVLQGRYEEAVTQFEQVVRLTPDNATGYNRLGGVYYYSGRYEEAIQAWQRVLEIESTPTYLAFMNLAVAHYWNQDYSSAVRMYEAALGINDEDPRIWLFLGYAYYWTETERDKAQRAWQQAIVRAKEQLAVNPRDLPMLVRIARAYEEIGEREQALSVIPKIIALDPADQSSLFLMAILYERMGDREQALAWLEKAILSGLSFEHIERDPWLQALLTDARYQRLYQRYGPPARPEAN